MSKEEKPTTPDSSAPNVGGTADIGRNRWSGAKNSGSIKGAAKSGAKAAGAAGLDKVAGAGTSKLLSKKSTSDGSVKGDIKEVAEGAKTGASIGSKIDKASGGATAGAGTAIGSAVGGVVSAAKQKRTRRTVLALMFLPLIAWILLGVVTFLTLTNVGGGQQDGHNASSSDSAKADGVEQSDIDAAVEASRDSGVQWQMLAAINKVIGSEENPFGIEDRDNFNDYARKKGTPMLSESEFEIPERVGNRVGQSLASGVNAFNPWVDPGLIEKGAKLKEDGTGMEFVGETAMEYQKLVKEAFVETLSQMPLRDAEKHAEEIYDTALRWITDDTSPSVRCDNYSVSNVVAEGDGEEEPRIVLEMPSGLGGGKVEFYDEHIGYVALAVKIGKDNNITDKGIMSAVMTMLVETKVRNLTHGDRDSQGLFQQRPSMGWGTVEEVTNPEHAIKAYYGLIGSQGMLQLKPAYNDIPLGEISDLVQRSAYPERYAMWESGAAKLIEVAAGVDVNAGGCESGAVGSVSAEDDYLPYMKTHGVLDAVDEWSFFWGQCTSFAAYKVATTSKHPNFTNSYTYNGKSARFGNAHTWDDAARKLGIPVLSEPAPGDIFVDEPNVTSSVGHVGFITKVYDNGNVDIAEYNVPGGSRSFNTRIDFDWKAENARIGTQKEFIRFGLKEGVDVEDNGSATSKESEKL